MKAFQGMDDFFVQTGLLEIEYRRYMLLGSAQTLQNQPWIANVHTHTGHFFAAGYMAFTGLGHPPMFMKDREIR